MWTSGVTEPRAIFCVYFWGLLGVYWADKNGEIIFLKFQKFYRHFLYKSSFCAGCLINPQEKCRGEIIFSKMNFIFGPICGQIGVERTRANAREARIMGEASISFGTFHRDKGMIVRRDNLFLWKCCWHFHLTGVY